jgi:hypothetical protein
MADETERDPAQQERLEEVLDDREDDGLAHEDEEVFEGEGASEVDDGDST